MHIIYNESERRLESFHRSCSYFPAMLCSALPSSDERRNKQQQKYCFVRCFSYFICYNLVVLCAFLTTYCYDCIVVVLFFHSCCSAFISCLFLFLVAYIYAIALVCLAVVANNEWLEFLIVCLRYDGDGAECSFFSLFSFLARLTLQFTYNGIWKFHISIKCFVFRLSRLVCWRFFLLLPAIHWFAVLSVHLFMPVDHVET